MSNRPLKISLFYSLVFSFLFFPPKVLAQVVINEFSSGTTSDWIELFNTSTESINISSYKLMDSGTNSKTLTGEVLAGGFVSFSFSNWLNNSADTVRLFKDEILVDSISYGEGAGICAASGTESIGRKPDGIGNFVKFVSSTRDLPNTSSEVACPTPTPTLVPTQTSVPTSTPTPTPMKTPTPTPSKTPTPKPTTTPKSDVEGISDNSGGGGDILALRNQLVNEEASPSGDEEGSKKKFPVFPVILIIFGAGLMGFAGYTLFKKMKSEGYNSKSEENN